MPFLLKLFRRTAIRHCHHRFPDIVLSMFIDVSKNVHLRRIATLFLERFLLHLSSSRRGKGAAGATAPASARFPSADDESLTATASIEGTSGPNVTVSV